MLNYNNYILTMKDGSTRKARLSECKSHFLFTDCHDPLMNAFCPMDLVKKSELVKNPYAEQTLSKCAVEIARMHIKSNAKLVDAPNIDLLIMVNEALEHAATKYKPEFTSNAEAFGAVTLEYLEVREEFMDHSQFIDFNKTENAIHELTQLAAMCFKSIRFLQGKENVDR